MEKTNKMIAAGQPELHLCDYCEDYSTTRYAVDIITDFDDEGHAEGSGYREWPFQLCRHCYYNWLEGRLSTKELVLMTNHNIDRRTKEKLAGQPV